MKPYLHGARGCSQLVLLMADTIVQCGSVWNGLQTISCDNHFCCCSVDLKPCRYAEPFSRIIKMTHCAKRHHAHGRVLCNDKCWMGNAPVDALCNMLVLNIVVMRRTHLLSDSKSSFSASVWNLLSHKYKDVLMGLNGSKSMLTFFSLPSSVKIVPVYTTNPFGGTWVTERLEFACNVTTLTAWHTGWERRRGCTDWQSVQATQGNMLKSIESLTYLVI